MNRFDLAVLQLQAAQAVRELLDSFYASFEQQQQQEVEDGNNLPGEEGRHMDEDRPIDVW